MLDLLKKNYTEKLYIFLESSECSNQRELTDDTCFIFYLNPKYLGARVKSHTTYTQPAREEHKYYCFFFYCYFYEYI